jgi:uncharacterized protein YjbI with pentapeptide repeats
MKIQKPKLLPQLPEVYDFMEVLGEAKQNETEIEEMHFKGACCIGEDISETRFSNILLENCRFNECSFKKSSFVDVVFKNCDFSNCDMSQAYFNRCEFRMNKALGAKFVESILKDVAIYESNFSYVNFDKTKIDVAEMKECNLESANLTECKIKGLECDGVKFISTNFFKTPLKGIDFTKSTITGMVVSAEGTELRGAIVDLYQAAELAKLFGVIIR